MLARLALLWGGLVLAAAAADALSAAEQQAMRAWQEQILTRSRAAQPAPAPDWVKAVPDGIARLLVEKHLFRGGPVWGLARRFPDSKLDYEEEGTAICLGVIRDLKLFDRVPGYNEAERQKMIRFWQSWQDPRTGRFVDPRDRKREVNDKYVIGILNWLGAKPLYPWSTTVARPQAAAPSPWRPVADTAAPARPYAHVDTRLFLQRTREDPDWAQGGWGVGSHTGAMAMELCDAVDAGRDDLIADLERGLNQILAHQGTDGLWGPPSAPLTGRLGGALKLIQRLYFYRGLVVPRSRELADSLIQHQLAGDFFRANGDACIPHNTAILLGYCLEVSSYRRDDLLRALAGIVTDMRAYVNPDGGVAFRRGGPSGVDMVFMNGLGVLGGYLHWQGCPFANPQCYQRRGAGYPHWLSLTADGQVKVTRATALLPPWLERP